MNRHTVATIVKINVVEFMIFAARVYSMLAIQGYPNFVFVYKVGQCIKLGSGVCVCTVLANCVCVCVCVCGSPTPPQSGDRV